MLTLIGRSASNDKEKVKIGISILNAWMTQNFGYDFVRLLVDKKLYGTNKKKWRGLINGVQYGAESQWALLRY